jgi:hypothetical protein
VQHPKQKFRRTSKTDTGHGVKSTTNDKEQEEWRMRGGVKWKAWKEAEEYQNIVPSVLLCPAWHRVLHIH